MNAQKLIAVLLIVGGGLALAYGGFTYTKDTHKASVGSLSISVSDKERVNVPIWAGVAALLAGGILLVAGRKS